MEIVILSIIVSIAVFLSIVATWMVRRSVVLTRFQKGAQIVLVWIVPFLGAIAVISILTDPKERRRRQANGSSSNEGQAPADILAGRAVTTAVMVGTEETGGMAEMVAGIEWVRGSVAHSFRRSARV